MFDSSDTRRQSASPEYEYESPYINSPTWPWVITGIVLAITFVVATLLFRSCA